ARYLPVILQKRRMIMLADGDIGIIRGRAARGHSENERRDPIPGIDAGTRWVWPLREDAIEIESRISDAARVEGRETLVISRLQRVSREYLGDHDAGIPNQSTADLVRSAGSQAGQVPYVEHRERSARCVMAVLALIDERLRETERSQLEIFSDIL